MKNPTCLVLALLLSLLCAACGKREHPSKATEPIQDALPAPETMALPENWPGPGDLPACPGFLSVEESSGDAQAGEATVLSSHSPSDLSDFYTDHLAADGWVMASSFRQGKDFHLQFRRGTRFVRIQILPAAAKPAAAQLRLAWSMPKGAPLAADSQAPDYGEEQSEPVIPSVEW